MGQLKIFVFILMFYFIGNYYTLAHESTGHSEHEDNMLWCRICGVHVADITDSVNMLSKGAIKAETRNILGRNITVQTLVNPYKYIFDVLTTHRASCDDVGQNLRADSWFSGYTWRVCTCPHCKAQLGWTFEKILTNNVEDNNNMAPFHALMLTALLAVTNDSQLAELTTPYTKSEPLSRSTQSGLVPRANEDISNPPTTISEDNTIGPKPVTPSNDTSTTKSEKKNFEGKIVILKNRSRNSTASKSNTVSGIRSSGTSHSD